MDFHGFPFLLPLLCVDAVAEAEVRHLLKAYFEDNAQICVHIGSILVQLNATILVA